VTGVRPSETTPRFRPTEARRAHLVSMIMMITAGCVQYAAGAIQMLLLGSLSGALGPGLMVLSVYVLAGTLFVLGGVWMWRVVSVGYTELTPAALVTRQTRTQVVEWHTITDIQPLRRGRYWRVRIHRHTGRSMILIAPLTRASRPDPRFTAELETMRAWWWQAVTGPGTSRSWPPAG
jgi:hypothetical protein